MKEKIGVYICQCGSNISDYIDVNRVRDRIKDCPGVGLAKITMFACSDSAQKEMIEDIRGEKLDGLVVASCSPKLHLATFKSVALRAGLNPYNYVQVNIREQGSWAHSDRPADATDKAIRMIEAGIARVHLARPLEPIRISTVNSVAVIGAGIAGLRAARELADMGSRVYLIEKDHYVGGRTAQWTDLHDTEKSGEEIISDLYAEIDRREDITLLTGATVKGMSGSVGNYEMEVELRPRYIRPEAVEERLAEMMERCPVSVEDDFNYALTSRKAVYAKYGTARPPGPMVDRAALEKESAFLAEYSDCIDLEQKPEIKKFKIGATILSTGFDPYLPPAGEYGYGEVEGVITLPQLKRLAALHAGGSLSHKGKKIQNLVFIYCVGSCQSEGENKYCSRFCCTAACATSLALKNKHAVRQIYHLYRQVRTYGKYEVLFDEALNQRDIFIKFDETDPPRVEEKEGKVYVTVRDLLTDGEELEIEPDLVVLITGMVPSSGRARVAEVFKAPLGRDSFFNEVHPKLRPVETVIDGVFISGACQGPKNISESVQSALSAASKANAMVSRGEMELEPTLAEVNPEICLWCGECESVCPFDSVQKVVREDKEVARINQATCKGCGICTPVCPRDAIDLIGYGNAEMESMIDALIKRGEDHAG